MQHPPDAPWSAPAHGFQGDRGTPGPQPGPVGLTVALSREAGARGGTIARRAARKLGWQVYDQELLEYVSQDAVARQGLGDGLSPPAVAWAEARLQELEREHALSQYPALVHLARVVLLLGAQGKIVLIGRGAGFILPRQTTLHARVVSPLPERIAYMAEWMRLTVEEAAEKVRARDERRAQFFATHFQRDAGAVHHYDLVLNSSLLGEDACAELIAQAARAREEQLGGKG